MREACITKQSGMIIEHFFRNNNQFALNYAFPKEKFEAQKAKPNYYVAVLQHNLK